MTYLEIAGRCRQAAGIVGQGWCQGEAARTVIGEPTIPNADDAVTVCMGGALVRASEGDSSLIPAVIKTWFHNDLCRLTLWNDIPERTQADVVAKLHEIADAAELKAVEVGEVPEPPVVAIRKTEVVTA